MATGSGVVVSLLGGVPGEQAMGGAEMQIAQWGTALRDRGWDVTFVVNDAGGQPDDYVHDGFRFITGYTARYTEKARRSLLMRIPGLRFWLGNLPRFWRALAAADADVYLVRSATRLLGIAALFCRVRKRLLVFSAANPGDVGDKRHNAARAGQDRLFRYGLGHADIICVQHPEQQQILRDSLGREGHVMPNVVSFPITTPADPDGTVVLWIGSIRPIKRPLLAMDIAAAVPAATFRFIGWNPADTTELGQEFSRRAEALPNVELAGYVAHEDLPDQFRQARALLHTSPPGGEGFPNVFLEAWAHAVPVVCSFDPGGLVADNQLGIVAGDDEAFAPALRRLIEDEDTHAALAANAFDYVKREHSPGAIGDRLDGLLRQALADQRQLRRGRRHDG